MTKFRSDIRRVDSTSQGPGKLWVHGLAAIGDEQWEEAIATFQTLLNLEREPGEQTRASIYANINSCYLDLERFDEALAALEEAEKLTPDDPALHYKRGLTYACMGKSEAAITAIETFRRRWPHEARKFDIRTMLKDLRRIAHGELPQRDYWATYLHEIIELDIEFGDYQRVESHAHRMIAANPARPEGHFALGLACLEQERYEEARDALLIAHDYNPDHIATNLNLGLTYIKSGAPEQAIPWLERVLEREANNVRALHQMGMAHERLGQRDEALAWYRRALKVSPKDYAVQERLHEMGEGPEPSEPPLPPKFREMRRLTPLIKRQMRRPRVYRNGSVTVTHDDISFIVEDTENPRNATVYSGGPFGTRRVHRREHDDLLDMLGLFKMTLRIINALNTRHVAILVYYEDRPVFHYQARFENGEMVEFDSDGQFVVTEVPRMFKMNIDSDLSTPYGNPMQGLLIFLNRPRRPGILISTLTPG